MLALDPYYEMFPSSYQRPYPYWYRYGLGAAATPASIADVDLICADGSTLFCTAGYMGRTGTADRVLRAFATQLSKTITDLGLRLPGLGLPRTDGVVDTATVDIVQQVLAQTVSSVPAPTLKSGFFGVSPYDVARQAPGLLWYLQSAQRKPTLTTPSKTVMPSKPAATSRTTTGTKVAIGVGVGLAALGVGAWLFTRR